MTKKREIKKKRTVLLILWAVYSIAALFLMLHAARIRNRNKVQNELIAQADIIAGQIPSILENNVYYESASMKMKAAKLDALVFALDDRKDIDQERDLLDDFASQADIYGLAVYDQDGELLYVTEGCDRLIAGLETMDIESIRSYAEIDEAMVYEAIMDDPDFLRQHFFSSDNLILEEESEAEQPEEGEEDPNEDVGEAQVAEMQMVYRLSQSGRWILVTGNLQSRMERKSRESFDWISVLGGIRIGETGYLLAIDENSGFVFLDDSGRSQGVSVESLDIRIGEQDHAAALEELKGAFGQADQTVRISIMGESCYAVRVKVDDILMLALLPEKEVSDTANGGLYMRILLLVLMTGICVLYVWFHLGHTAGMAPPYASASGTDSPSGSGSPASAPVAMQRRGKISWNRVLSGRLAACAILAGAAMFASCLFLELLSVHADTYLYSQRKASEAEEAYIENRTVTIQIQEWFKEEYLDRCRVARVILDHADEEDVNWDFLEALSNSLDIRYLYLFDDQGKIILTNSPYDRIIVNPENPFYSLLEGRAEMALDPQSDELSGEMLLKTGLALRDENHICKGLILTAADAVELDRIMENLGIKNIFERLCMEEGSGILVVDDEELTVTANAEMADGMYRNSLGGTDYTGYPIEKSGVQILDKAGLREGYNGRMAVTGKEYFACVLRSMNQFFVMLSEERQISVASFAQPAIVTGAVLLFVLLLAVISCSERAVADDPEEIMDTGAEETGSGHASKTGAGEDEAARLRTKSSEEGMMAVLGTIMNREKPYFEERWPDDVIRWRDKEPGGRFVFLLRLILTAAFAAMFINVLLAKESSLWHYVLGGEWDSGINLHSFTGCVIYICLLLVLKPVIHKVLFVVARAADARGETICHLMDNASGYVLGIIGIILCLSKLGLDIRSLSLTAGAFGVVFGICCQSTVADILSGILMSFEGIVHVGDFLFFDGKSVEVLSIGIRTTRLKFFSEVTVVRNAEFKNYVLRPMDKDDLVSTSITIDLRESLERVEGILEKEMPKIHERLCALSDDTLKGPNYGGVSKITEKGVELAFSLVCKGRYCLNVQRAMNRELKLLCERYGIAIAITQVMVHEPEAGSETDGIKKDV